MDQLKELNEHIKMQMEQSSNYDKDKNKDSIDKIDQAEKEN